MSSVLPWRSCGASWEGSTLAEKMSVVLSALREHVDEATLWGGDWNQALEGRDYVGSADGRKEILALLTGCTARCADGHSGSCGERASLHRPHRRSPSDWDVTGVQRLEAAVEGHRLSDHDAYVVEVKR